MIYVKMGFEFLLLFQTISPNIFSINNWALQSREMLNKIKRCSVVYTFVQNVVIIEEENQTCVTFSCPIWSLGMSPGFSALSDIYIIELSFIINDLFKSHSSTLHCLYCFHPRLLFRCFSKQKDSEKLSCWRKDDLHSKNQQRSDQRPLACTLHPSCQNDGERNVLVVCMVTLQIKDGVSSCPSLHFFKKNVFVH